MSENEIERIRVHEPNPTVRSAILQTLDRSGFGALDEADVESFTRIVVYDLSAPLGEAQTEAHAYFERLPADTAVVLLCLAEDRVPDAVRTHPRVVEVLVKPFQPIALRDALLRISPKDLTSAQMWARVKTREVRHAAPTHVGRQPDARSALVDFTIAPPPSAIWADLAEEIAELVEEWSRIGAREARIAAIAEWLESRLEED